MQDDLVRLDVDYGEQTFNRTFGDRVRDAREALKWSQRKLAEELDKIGVKLDPSAVTRIERGTREVKLREAAAVAAVLKVPIQDLAPPPALSPLAQFESCLELGSEQGGVARQALASMSVFYAMAIHLVSNYPDSLMKELGVQNNSDLFDALVEATTRNVSKAPVAIATQTEEAELLTRIVNATVSNLIVVEGSSGQGDAGA